MRGKALFGFILAILAVLLTACVTPAISVATPAGFAPFEMDDGWGAISPEGVRITARLVDNSPQQDLEFWGEALERHLVSAGYLLRHGDRFVASGVDGQFFEWIAPVGTEDWVYLTAVIPYEDELAVFEAAAPYELYVQYEEEIHESLQTVGRP